MKKVDNNIEIIKLILLKHTLEIENKKLQQENDKLLKKIKNLEQRLMFLESDTFKPHFGHWILAFYLLKYVLFYWFNLV